MRCRSDFIDAATMTDDWIIENGEPIVLKILRRFVSE